METKHFYTDERNAQIVIALLKAHGILHPDFTSLEVNLAREFDDLSVT